MTKTKRRRSTVKKSSVTLRWRELNDGTLSPFLDIYFQGKRKTETLTDIGRKGIDRRQDKEVEERARLISADRLREIRNHKYNFDEVYKGEASFLEYYKKYKDDFDKHSPQDVAYLHFENFVKAYIKSSMPDITFNQIDVKFIEAFRKYLLGICRAQNTASMYFNVFKRVVKKAFIEDIISKDITVKVKNIPVEEKLINYLNEDEIKKLNNTECKMNPEVKRAFLFACFTGLRFSDLNNLQYKSIQGNKLQKIQKKTGTPYYLELQGTALNLLTNKHSNILPHPEAYVFNLPSKAYYNTILKDWFKTAGIDKRASSHVARHTAACLVKKYTNDIQVVQVFLGQRDIKSTMRYAKIDNEKLNEAVSRLPNWEVAL